MIKELDHQTRAVDELVEQCAKLLQSGGERKKLVFKAPTGAGKTVMASLLLERLGAGGRAPHQGCGGSRRSCGSRRTSCTSRAETRKEQP